MFKKQLLNNVYNNKIYKAMVEKLPEDQKKIIEKHLEAAAEGYAANIIEKFSKVVADKNAQKAMKEIFNKEIINEKTGKAEE